MIDHEEVVETAHPIVMKKSVEIEFLDHPFRKGKISFKNALLPFKVY